MNPHRLPRILSRLGARRFLAPFAITALCACVADLPSARAQDGTLTEWALPGTPNVLNVVGQTALPVGDGAIYVTESAGGKIAKLNTKTNELTEWAISETGNPIAANGLARTRDRIFFTFANQQPLSSQSASGSLTWGGASGGAIVVGPVIGGVIAPGQPVTFTGGIGALNLGTEKVTEWATLGGPTNFPVRGGSHIYFLEPFDNRVGSLNWRDGHITEWELPAPPPATVGSGSILFGGPATVGLEDFFAGVPTSSGILIGSASGGTVPSIATVGGLGIDQGGENLWFSEDVTNRIARLNLATNTLTEWAIPISENGPFQAHVREEVVYFTAGDAVMRLDANANVISVWVDPNGTTCLGPPCLPTVLADLSITETESGEGSGESDESMKVYFSIGGAAISSPFGQTVITPQIGEFDTAEAPHTDYTVTPVISVLTPVDSTPPPTIWAASKAVTQLVPPTVTTIPADQTSGFTFWSLEIGPGPTLISRFPEHGLVFTRLVGNKVALFAGGTGDPDK